MTVGLSDAAKTCVEPFELKGLSVIGCVPRETLLRSESAPVAASSANVTRLPSPRAHMAYGAPSSSASSTERGMVSPPSSADVSCLSVGSSSTRALRSVHMPTSASRARGSAPPSTPFGEETAPTPTGVMSTHAAS